MPRSKQVKKTAPVAPQAEKSKTTKEVAQAKKVAPPPALQKPKRPMSGYLRFCNQARPKITAENPGAKLGDISKLMGAQWRALSDKEKVPFNDAYNQAMVGHKKVMEEYNVKLAALPTPPLTPTKGGNGKKKRKKKDPNAPKRPLNGYFRFQKVVKAKVKSENPEAKITEIAKLIGAQWKTMSDSDKAPFNDAFKKDMVTYNVALEAYKKKKEAENPCD